MKNRKNARLSSETDTLLRKINKLEAELSLLKETLQDQEKQKQILQYRLDLNGLSLVEPFHNIISAVIDSAEKLTGSRIGFLHFYNEEKKTVQLQTWSTKTLTHYCRTHPWEEHYNLDSAGVWTDCIKLRRPVIHNDYNSLHHKKGMPSGHAHVIRQMIVPIVREGAIVGVLGVGNKQTDYTEKDIENLSKFSDVAWEIIMNRKLHQALEEKEERHRTLLNTMFEGVTLNELVFDENREIVNYRILEANDSMDRHFSVSRKIVGSLATDVFNITSGEIREFWNKHYLTEEPILNEIFHKKTGRWIRISTSPLRETKFTTVFFDITELKLSAELQKKNENRYHTVIETSLEGFMIVGPDGFIKEVNSTYVRMSGYSRDEILSMHITEFDASETHQATMEHAERIIAQGSEVFETVHRKKNGSLWHAEVSITFLNIDGGLFYVFIKNITRRKESEKVLDATIKILSLINKKQEIPELLNESCSIFMEFTGCEAAAIRYNDREYFPPDGSQGFSSPLKELICDNLLLNRTDQDSSCFTNYGSFWTNSVSEFLEGTTEGHMQSQLKNVSKGYESVALIPLRIGQETLGLLSLNDSRRNILDVNKVNLLERLSAYISGALSHFESSNLIKNSETRYRKISSLISNIAYSCKKENGCFSFDWLAGSVEKTFGYSIEEMYKWKCWKFLVTDEDITKFQKNILELKPGEKSDCELRIKTRDGSVRWIKSIAECDYASENKAESVIFGGIIDISDDKIAEESLRKARIDLEHSRDLMSYVIEHNRGAVAVHDRDMKYIYVSQRYLSDFRVKEENIIGKHHYEVFPDLPQKLRIAHQEALKGKVVSKEEDNYVHDDGTIDWTRWECRPWYEADKSIGGIIVYTEIISERKKMEVALRTSEMQLNTLFNSAPVIMILIDEQTRVLRMNRFGLESKGLDSENLHCLKPGDVLRCARSDKNPHGCGTGEECKTCIIRKTITETFLTGREFYKTEAELISGNEIEKLHTVLVSTSVISTTPEKQVLLTVDDITDRKELEKELVKARIKAEESDNLKSAFLANISHEIRTPMNGIMGFSEMLSKPGLSEEKRNQFSSLIQDGCRQLLGIINDVIEISMLDTDQVVINKSNLNLNEFMQDIFQMFRLAARNKNLNLCLRSSNNRRPEIYSDRDKLKQVFSNIVSNAIKFTKQGSIDLGYTLNNKEVIFFVKDTGIGIRKELHNAVFERFRQVEISDTRNYSGTGLGLSISRGLVNLLGGEIWIESEPDKGTTVFFNIPEIITDSAADVIENPLTESEKNKILIAEDDEINYLYLEEVLQELMLKSVHASNGSEAIEIFKANPSIRLILMDIKMPVMDGYKAAAEIRKLNSHIPIIAQTAFPFNGHIVDLKRYGFNDLISKPIEKSKLDYLLKQYLHTAL